MSATKTVEEVLSAEYPTSHLGHLSSAQTEALNEFKTICQTRDYYVPSSNGVRASHDDETLLRFLRARKFVPNDAFEQFAATEDWRKQQDIDGWYSTIDVDDYERTRLLYTQWTGRRDKRGIPLYVFQISGVDSKKLSAYEAASGKEQPAQADGQLSPKLRRLFATYEHLTTFVMPLCTAVPSRPYLETPISQTCNIVDISGVGLRQFWSLKAHLQDASTLATAHYPETLGRTFVIGAPSFFPTIWNWLKGWFDPITVSKIFILAPSEVKPTLEQFIDSSNLPRQYGGSLDWQFGQLPNVDPEILQILKMEKPTFPKGPLRWKDSPDGSRVEAYALGTEHGKQRNDLVCSTPADTFARR